MKNLYMELMGTFFLMLAICLAGNPLAVGLMLCGLVYMGMYVSGAHYNPAVSLALYCNAKKKDFGMLMKYMVVQTLAAALACGLCYMYTGNAFLPQGMPGGEWWSVMLLEALMVFVLCYVVLSVMVSKKLKGCNVEGLVIGLTLAALLFIGGVFNPAVVFGSMLFSWLKMGSAGAVKMLLSYAAGGLLGGWLAGCVYGKLSD